MNALEPILDPETLRIRERLEVPEAESSRIALSAATARLEQT